MRRGDTAKRTVRTVLNGPLNTPTRLFLCALSGVALGLAFPKFDFSLLAWIAFVPLLLAVEGEKPRRIFGYGWVQGFACYLVSLYWVQFTLHHFAGVNPILAAGPLLLLAAVEALYTGLVIWAAELAATRLRLPIFVTLPIAWPAVEWLRSIDAPIAFPWGLVGYTAYRSLALIQFAEITGVYGVSALIVFFNAVIFVVVFERDSRRRQTWSLGALTAVMIAVLAFGTIRIGQLRAARPAGRIRVAMVQGDIPQSIKWDPTFLETSFNIYADQTRQAAHHHVDLVVWPEAAAAFFFQPNDVYPPRFAGDALYRERLLKLAESTSVPILFGAPALGRAADGSIGTYNRAYLVSGAGKVVGYYDKIQLVPFGEYVPFRAVLGFVVNRIVHGFGDMIPGTAQTLFEVKGARLAVLICYESIFPDLTRRAVKSGADVLVNITNDAWYGKSSAPHQLLAMAALRSVETKVPMVRVANTGISAIVHPDGRITARTPLFQRGTEIEDVAWRPRRTVYTLVGDLFSEICFVLTVLGLLLALLRGSGAEAAPSPIAGAMSRNGHG
jgi:apolipoprotein N-acyltransferase